jgi:hypothetical protein
MKALAMLDHVMLWVARFTSFALCILFSANALKALSDSVLPYACVEGLLVLASIGCGIALWFQKRSGPRLYVTVFAVFLLLVTIYGIWDTYSFISKHVTNHAITWGDLDMTFYALIFLGLAAIIWASARPAQNLNITKVSLTPSTHVNPV